MQTIAPSPARHATTEEAPRPATPRFPGNPRQLQRFFGKRGGPVVDANLAVVKAAYDGLIDVTGAICATPPTTPKETIR